MAVYYRFKSAKNYDTLKIDSHFISVLNLKEQIFESKHMRRGRDYDLIITNAQTNQEYVDESMLIPSNTSVLVCRIPGPPCMSIVCRPKVEDKVVDEQLSNSLAADSSVSNYFQSEASEFDDFGDDIYVTASELTARQSSIPVPDSIALSKAEEDGRVKALTESSIRPSFSSGRGFGFQQKTPPQGYICHRCNIPGHYIQHCPTNGNPNFHIRKVNPTPHGMARSGKETERLPSTRSNVNLLPHGMVRPGKETERLPSSRSIVNLPPELHCPICKEVMRDAVFTSKCCFSSFCDKCIRDCITLKSMCYCRATNILVDDLLPNATVRDTIKRILESGNDRTNSSTITDDAGDSVHVQVGSCVEGAKSYDRDLRCSLERKRSRDQGCDSDSKRHRSGTMELGA